MKRYDAGASGGRGWVDAGSLAGQSSPAGQSSAVGKSGVRGQAGVGIPSGVGGASRGESRSVVHSVRRQGTEEDVWGSVFDRRNIISFLTASTTVLPITFVGTLRLV